MGKYIQEFEKGEVYESGGRTITETDIVMFTAISWDTNPAHNDDVWCKTQSPLGRRIAHGALTFSAVTGLSARSGFLDGTAIAFLSVDEWNFHNPVWIGDTVRMRTTVIEARVSESKPDRGILKRKMEVFNQREELVQSGIFTTLVKARKQ